MNLESFFREVAGLQPPSRLIALRLLLAGADHDLLDPRETAGIFPLLIPLARDDQGHILGFLRWPTPPEGLEPPLVRQAGATLGLVARSLDEWLHSELAQRDAAGEDLGGLLGAANRPGPLYAPGELAASRLPLPAYLLMRAGVSFGFFEELMAAHREKGDVEAALVTADRALRYAPGWARPHAVRARLYAELGRREEAAEAARAALLEPVWTLGEPVEATALLAGWQAPVSSVAWRRLAEDARKLPADRAAHLLDAVSAEGGDWDAARPALAALYREAGLEAVARMVGRPSLLRG